MYLGHGTAFIGTLGVQSLKKHHIHAEGYPAGEMKHSTCFNRKTCQLCIVPPGPFS